VTKAYGLLPDNNETPKNPQVRYIAINAVKNLIGGGDVSTGISAERSAIRDLSARRVAEHL